MSLTAYIRYDNNNRIVPGGPIVTKKKPAVGNWQVVTEGTSVTLSGKLRAFIKVDRFGKPLAGSLFLGKEQPATGKWIEVDATYTGTATPTTSTTTTRAITTTTTTTIAVPTSPMYGGYTDANSAQWIIKNTVTGIYEGLSFYTQALVYFQGNLGIGTRLYRDAAFTDPITNQYGGIIWITLKQTPMNFANLNGSQIVYTIDSNGYVIANNLTINNVSYRYYPQPTGGNWYYREGYSPYYPFTTNCSQYFNTAYTAPTSDTIQVGTTVYTSLSPASHSPEFGFLSYNGNVYSVATDGVVESLVTNCGGTTTTTTTSPFHPVQVYTQGGSNNNQLCPQGSTGQGVNNYWCSTPVLQAGSILYYQPNYQSIIQPGGFWYKQVGYDTVWSPMYYDGVLYEGCLNSGTLTGKVTDDTLTPCNGAGIDITFTVSCGLPLGLSNSAVIATGGFSFFAAGFSSQQQVRILQSGSDVWFTYTVIADSVAVPTDNTYYNPHNC